MVNKILKKKLLKWIMILKLNITININQIKDKFMIKLMIVLYIDNLWIIFMFWKMINKYLFHSIKSLRQIITLIHKEDILNFKGFSKIILR